ncbi:MAG: single-stranded DNA-binding protein [Clostridia bacterium]|nr:single-stranded DNA-binding protein [Clostridia bacterium]MBP3801753.1 single-stranded DNA-binding protein [Clostridia bacterium]
MNKVILLGRLTKDVELKYTQTSNTAVASFSLAVNRKYAKQGETRETDFFNIIAWNKLAETASKYLKKGMQILITGRLQTRYWDDEQGQRHYVTEIIAEELDFVENKKEQSADESVLMSSTPVTQNEDDFSINGDDLPF